MRLAARVLDTFWRPARLDVSRRREGGEVVEGVELSGCGDGSVGCGSHVIGGIDRAAPGRFGERDDVVGRDLMWYHPLHSLVWKLLERER
jgi:hypothetical protein